MQRIAIITDAWQPQVNGVVTVLNALTEGLKKRGKEVILIHPGLFTTVPVPFYPELPFSLFPRKKLERLVLAANADAIHIVTEGPLGWAARAVCKNNSLTFTTSYHTNFHLYAEAWFGSYFEKPAYTLIRQFHAEAARTMVPTAGLKQELEKRGFSNLSLWPLGVDAKLFSRHQSVSVPSFPKPVYLYFGRLTPEKNIEEFLALPLEGTKLVIGNGPYRDRLYEKYGTEARFIGYKHGEELVKWLSCADVFVFPSRTDTFGLTIIEALACGIPVAAHVVTGPRDILTHGVDGYLSEDLLEAARACLGLSREDCRTKALAYSWETSAEIFLENLCPIR